MSQRRVNLDQIASGPIRPCALAAVIETLKAGGGDPSRSYAEALEARERLEMARAQVAEILDARSREVVFTSGRTESVATVIAGVDGPQAASVVEHSSISQGVERVGGVLVGADHHGRIDPAELATVDDVALIHIQWANHEVGTRQPVDQAVEVARRAGAMVHLDATIGAGHESLSFRELDVDFMTVEASAFGGPAGIGALLIRRGLRIDPLILGGDQERARRAGLENVAGAAAMAAALNEADEDRRHDPARERRLTQALCETAMDQPDVTMLGDPIDRAPQLICVAVDGIEPQAVVINLDRAGIATHSGNSCSSEALEASPVLEAMGVDAHRSLRLSVGWCSGAEDVEAFRTAFGPALESLRELSNSATVGPPNSKHSVDPT